MFGILIFALNEGKFIRYALRGYLSTPLVKKIAVVEGCVRLNAHAANEEGLSKDNMAEVVRGVMVEDETNRIVYERMGWVENKTTLQTRCVELIEDAPGIEYYILAGADEIYDPADLERLRKEIDRLGKPDVPLYEFVHFWKRPDLRAVGSMWETWMHRCYRNHGKGMRFAHHAAPPVKPDGGKLRKGVKTRGVRVYHYTGMKDEQDIKDRLQFYRNRDNKGKDTWTNWSPGKSTQWTHGGGTAEPYSDGHPPAIAADVWSLVPGKLAPKAKVFISHVPEEQEKVKGFVTELAALCPVTVISLIAPEWEGVEFRGIGNLGWMLKGLEMLIVANRHLILRPVARHNVLFAYSAIPDHKPPVAGYKVVCLDERIGKTWSGKAVQVGDAAEFLSRLADLPVVIGDGPSYSTYPTYSARAGFVEAGFMQTGSVGKPATAGKLNAAGRVKVVSTRPLVVIWDFVNPLPEKLVPKHGQVCYELATAAGRVIRSMRSVTTLPPDLLPGGSFPVEITLPVYNLPSGEYEARFDFRYRTRLGKDHGIKPLKIMFVMDKRKHIWVR